MNPNADKRHVIDTVFVICLLLLFLLSALTVIAIGASIYKKNVAQTSENYSQRVSIAYITEKVRQSDINGAIYVEELFGKNVLVMQQTVDDELYNTYIYDYNGYLMELFARADLNNFYPQSGQKILKIHSFDISQISESLLSAVVTSDNGVTERFFITVRSESAE
ncbi:DUF4860 domain-containing protein [Butyrivibrio sp. YAB3001]|uniref:DUF4860 domain-containing protein n=1 Tax=Butyrivibrio sp. YAB3001 TaxID=1520812 RepID=UPI0008F66108|nr:DUF4860 domain-containing protein [Butyrivibrio sp. YAB3001]SFB76070.1 protein of unknown function [Butyrivibrio sp. YAB3001]